MLNTLQEKIAKLPRSVSIIGLILFIASLYFITQKAVIPLVMKVVASDLFFEKEEESEELGKITNDRSIHAFAQCKSIMLSEKHVPDTAEFVDKEYEAWALGGRTYLIRSQINITTPEKGVEAKKYACKIRYNGGNPVDAKSWEALGVDFNEQG